MKEMFSFEGHDVRVIDREGEPWWVAKDVCDAIGIANNRSAIARLDADDVGKIEMADSLGRKQQMSIINTFGVYELIFRSDKLEAKRMKRWVTHDVLPLIRKSGARKIENQSPKNMFSVMRGMIDLLEASEKQLAALQQARPTV